MRRWGVIALLVAIMAIPVMTLSAQPEVAGSLPAAPSAVPAVPAASARVTPGAAPSAASPGEETTVSPLDPPGGIFGPHSIWRTSIASAPVASDSTTLAQSLSHEVASLYNGVAALNVFAYSTNFYTVGADQPTTDLTWDNCQDKDYTPDGLTGPGGILTAVPVPSYATPDLGTDGEMTIYSPSLDALWEFWRVTKTPSGWSACWGGHMTNVSMNAGYFSGYWGATATGLPVAGGMITINDVKAGVINHALSLLVPNTAVGSDYSWPAQRSDGKDTAANAIPEGTRFKLPASVDIAALHLSPLAAMVATAAQTYGFVVTDTAGAVAIPAESGVPLTQATGAANPWTSYLESTPTYDVFANFPWSSLQALPHDYGE